MRGPTWLWICLAGMMLGNKPAPGQNLIRNGSFEGTTKYWRGKMELDGARGREGDYAVRFSGTIHAAPVPLRDGERVTVAAWVCAEGAGRLGMSLEAGGARLEHQALAGGEWQRVVWEAAIPAGGDWSLALAAENDVWVDGVTITRDGTGRAGHVPASPVEVALVASNLPEAPGKVMGLGEEVFLLASVTNGSNQERSVRVRWEVLDYAGERLLDRAADDPMPLPPAGTRIIARRQKLPAIGLQRARLSVRDEAGRLLGSSDQPVTALKLPLTQWRGAPEGGWETVPGLESGDAGAAVDRMVRRAAEAMARGAWKGGDRPVAVDEWGQATGALGAYEAMAPAIGGARWVRTIRQNGAVVIVLERAGEGIGVAWMEKGARDVRLEGIRALDAVGNQLPEGVLRLGRPVYLQGAGPMSGEALGRAVEQGLK